MWDRKSEEGEGREEEVSLLQKTHLQLAYKFHVGQRNLRAKLESRVWATPAILSLPSEYLSGWRTEWLSIEEYWNTMIFQLCSQGSWSGNETRVSSWWVFLPIGWDHFANLPSYRTRRKRRIFGVSCSTCTSLNENIITHARHTNTKTSLGSWNSF